MMRVILIRSIIVSHSENGARDGVMQDARERVIEMMSSIQFCAFGTAEDWSSRLRTETSTARSQET